MTTIEREAQKLGVSAKTLRARLRVMRYQKYTTADIVAANLHIKPRQAYRKAPVNLMQKAKGWKVSECAICHEVLPTCQDHCHATKKNRGRLCNRCNTGLGQFRDRLGLLSSAIRYLRKWK